MPSAGNERWYAIIRASESIHSISTQDSLFFVVRNLLTQSYLFEMCGDHLFVCHSCFAVYLVTQLFFFWESDADRRHSEHSNCQMIRSNKNTNGAHKMERYMVRKRCCDLPKRCENYESGKNRKPDSPKKAHCRCRRY